MEQELLQGLGFLFQTMVRIPQGKKPFSINAPNPKVKTKNGIAILVRIGQRIAFNKPMNSTKRSMSSNELSLIPNPKKPIR